MSFHSVKIPFAVNLSIDSEINNQLNCQTSQFQKVHADWRDAEVDIKWQVR